MSAGDHIFNAPAPRVYSIAAGRPFLRDLAEALHKFCGDDPTRLADVTIYLPTRRAVRALNEAFVATSTAHATLLPRVKALGDVEEDEFVAFAGDPDDEIEFAPSIAPLARRFALARLVAARDRRFFDGQERWAAAIAAADELGKLLDSFYTEEINPERLTDIVPEQFAAHWAHSLDFLSIVTKAWPAYLAEQNLMDPAERRVALINAQNERWRRSPPDAPIVIAGTTGSTPAVARLMKTVAALPHGAVVLPGLDLDTTAEGWREIDDPHPQSGLKHLLNSLDTSRDDVRTFGSVDDAVSRRIEMVSLSLRPAQATDEWRAWVEQARGDTDAINEITRGLSLIEAQDEEAEAAAIALKFRDVVATPGRTAMLVTPDRDLARRVAVKMRRWRINVDDSGGTPFSHTPCGSYLRLMAAWMGDISNPVALLAVLRHPLFGGALAFPARRRAVDEIDVALRGVPPTNGLKGLAERVFETEGLSDEARAAISAIVSAVEANDGPRKCFTDRLRRHILIAEALAADDIKDGAARLWNGDDGDAGAELMSAIMGDADLISDDRAGDYADIFDHLIMGAVVRRHMPAHPRLSILGPLEARLQNADVIILGGLNEGVWPREAVVDPFLSRPMRETVGLPSPERRIGLAAHDFAQLAASGEVMLTRAERAGRSPTKPSRWIVRLKNIVEGLRAERLIDETDYYATLALRLDAPTQIITVPTPQPTPPIETRPRRLSVTRLEKLMRDPYAIYASKILRLQKLDPPGMTAGPAQLGQLLHKVFERYVIDEKDHKETLANSLWSIFREWAPRYGFTPADEALWRPRITSAFDWFVSWDAHRREMSEPVILEATGELSLNAAGGPFTITARADRIDQMVGGDLTIIDYKSGAPPSLKQTKTFSPQLPLTGLIARHGGFPGVDAAPNVSFEYVRVLSRSDDAKDTTGASGADADLLITRSEEGLRQLIDHFDAPTTPYPSQPRAEFTDQYGDYDHLARRRERESVGGDE